MERRVGDQRAADRFDDPYGADPSGTLVQPRPPLRGRQYPDSKTINFPMSCLHCEDAACVTVCPTGASYKRTDGIVLVDQDRCMGCNLCAWACPYGARELDGPSGTMQEVHAVRRSHSRRAPARSRAPASVRAGVPDARAPFRRFRRSAVARVEADRGARRLRSAGRARLQAGESLPAPAQAAAGSESRKRSPRRPRPPRFVRSRNSCRRARDVLGR